MQYRTLGRTGIQVSTLVHGAMNVGAIGRTSQVNATAVVAPGVDPAPEEKNVTPPAMGDKSLRRR